MDKSGSLNAAYVTLLSSSQYTAGALTLWHTLRQVGSRYPLVVMHPPWLPKRDCDIMRNLGIILRVVEPLQPPVHKWRARPEDARFADTWIKLRVFELVEFSRVVLLDADMILRANIDDLMTRELKPDWIAACPVCACNPEKRPHYPKDWNPDNCPYSKLNHPEAATRTMEIKEDSPAPYRLLNSGNVVLTPSHDTMRRIYDIVATSDEVSRFQFPDQDLLSHVFRDRWQPLPYVYNGIKPSRRQHAHMWRDEEVKVVHYVLPEKPWHQRHRENDPYATLYTWWWDAWDSCHDEISLRATNDDIGYLEQHMARR